MRVSSSHNAAPFLVFSISALIAAKRDTAVLRTFVGYLFVYFVYQRLTARGLWCPEGVDLPVGRRSALMASDNPLDVNRPLWSPLPQADEEFHCCIYKYIYIWLWPRSELFLQNFVIY